MNSKQKYIIGVTATCGGCEKPFMLDKKTQFKLFSSESIACKSCDAELSLALDEKERLCTLGNPAKPLVWIMMLLGAFTLTVVTLTLFIDLAFGAVAMAFLIMIVGNLIIGLAIKGATKDLQIRLQPEHVDHPMTEETP